jgi:hypothetical protein
MSLKSHTRKLSWLPENYGKFDAAEVEKKWDTELAEDVRIIGSVVGDVKHSLHIDLICTDKAPRKTRRHFTPKMDGISWS